MPRKQTPTYSVFDAAMNKLPFRKNTSQPMKAKDLPDGHPGKTLFYQDDINYEGEDDVIVLSPQPVQTADEIIQSLRNTITAQEKQLRETYQQVLKMNQELMKERSTRIRREEALLARTHKTKQFLKFLYHVYDDGDSVLQSFHEASPDALDQIASIPDHDQYLQRNIIIPIEATSSYYQKNLSKMNVLNNSINKD